MPTDTTVHENKFGLYSPRIFWSTQSDIRRDILRDTEQCTRLCLGKNSAEASAGMLAEANALLSKNTKLFNFANFSLYARTYYNSTIHDILNISYGIAGVPGVLTKNGKTVDTLCVVRLGGYSKVPFDIARLEFSSLGNNQSPDSFVISSTSIESNLDYGELIKRDISSNPNKYQGGWSSPLLLSHAFAYNATQNNVELSNIISILNELTNSNESHISYPYARFIVSRTGNILVAKRGMFNYTGSSNSIRFLVVPGGILPILATDKNRGAYKDLLAHQLRWLDNEDLRSFQKAIGLKPSKTNDWDNYTKADLSRLLLSKIVHDR